MDYALCATYGYGHLPMKPLCFPSTLRTTTKLEFNLSHSSHLLYSGFTKHLPATKPVMSPVIRAVDKSASPSSDGKRGGKILRGVVGASLVLACAIGVFSCSCNLKPKAIAGPPTITSKKPSTEPTTQVLGAKYALNSFLEVTKILTSDEVQPLTESTNLPRKPSTADIWAAKTDAVRIIKSGNTSKAMASLIKAYKDCEGQPEQQYEVDMAIAEILLSQGKYEEALERNCLKSEVPVSKSDTRFYLYKALVHTMLDNKEAKKWWKMYIDTVGKGLDLPPRPM
ncbi:hypothetical protein HS088_TW01G00656 [Tripterygium wilfordii]|uniref:Uncharacterized protein n=1 Tax=Tripterygium wilfordii TaxID=458696 RepID=A0A7J7E2G8_TRIWF|nr:uncharacterized protein LOC119994883 [Tripterygium wilfordii]KAF5752739.1 hypothetical protein HS088_TW01G00656 [Tripterygium wilfordii]